MEDPQKYGVVVFDEISGEIEKFVEKPKVYVSNKINAGLYIFNKEILYRIDVSLSKSAIGLLFLFSYRAHSFDPHRLKMRFFHKWLPIDNFMHWSWMVFGWMWDSRKTF